ncbi:MAG: putative transcriptional regulator [Gammaproteobacteria bacterium]|nr:putative transcriptional regulator [Gammaproteobacteria bacterium]
MLWLISPHRVTISACNVRKYSRWCLVDINQVMALIQKGESHHLEFKKSTAQLKAAFETVCAFLNGQGGIVLIGVSDNGQVGGQEVTDNTRQEIAREISKIEPAARIEIFYLSVNHKKYVIAIEVISNNHAPYTYDGCAFERNQSTTYRMTQHRYEQLLVERGQLNHSWEESIATSYAIEDLDFDEIRLAVKQGIAAGRVPAIADNETIEGVLKSWNLIENGRINNAAVVLFAKNILPRYPQCHLKLGRFRGTDMLGDFIDNKEFFGNAFRMLAEANSFITRHLPIASFFEQDRFERIDKPALPTLAVREALVNAICHRDYSNRASSITLAIFDDRMEIWNSGKLPANLKIDDLRKKHKSESRNKIIAKVFYDRKYFDGWGTGIIKIFDLCRANDMPDPEYEQYSGGVEIRFKFKESIGTSKKPELLFLGLPSEYLVSMRQQNILKILMAGTRMTVGEITKNMKNPPSRRTIGDDLSSLKELGLVKLEGIGRGAKWFYQPKQKK